jgi:hypothetical protein
MKITTRLALEDLFARVRPVEFVRIKMRASGDCAICDPRQIDFPLEDVSRHSPSVQPLEGRKTTVDSGRGGTIDLPLIQEGKSSFSNTKPRFPKSREDHESKLQNLYPFQTFVH